MFSNNCRGIFVLYYMKSTLFCKDLCICASSSFWLSIIIFFCSSVSSLRSSCSTLPHCSFCFASCCKKFCTKEIYLLFYSSGTHWHLFTDWAVIFPASRRHLRSWDRDVWSVLEQRWMGVSPSSNVRDDKICLHLCHLPNCSSKSSRNTNKFVARCTT